MKCGRWIRGLAMTFVVVSASESRADEQSAYDGVERVHVDVVSGDVSVRRSNDDMVRVLGRRRRLSIEREGGKLEIESRSRSVDLAVPSGMYIEIETRSGDIVVQVDTDHLDLRSVSGSVEVDARADILEVRTMSGDIDVRGRARIFRSRTVSGDVDLRAELREADIKTTSGDVELEAELLPLRLELQTVSGDVELTGNLPADAFYRAQSMSGDLLLARRNEQGFRLEARTHAGRIRLSGAAGLERGALSTEVDGGGADLRFESFSGSIKIQRR